MINELPAPLISAEVDLRDFAFLPLDVLRLRDSELSATPDAEAFRCCVLSWCVSWHQLPAGSLPDDDVTLARLLGFGRDLKGWKKVRAADGLRGWVKCSDGRLYHPVVVEKAIEAWKGKLAQRWRTECARIKKHNQRHEISLDLPDYETWLSLGCPHGHPLPVPRDNKQSPQDTTNQVPRETQSKGEGERQGEGQGQGDLGKPSETIVSGGKPPAMKPDEIIFGYGIPLLVNAGTAEKQARSFLGGLRKAHGDKAVIDKLRECLKLKPLQPLEWLAAALPPDGIKGHSKQTQLESRNATVVDGWVPPELRQEAAA